MKLTGWYRGDQKPVRVGPYLRRYPHQEFFTWWDGEKWAGGAWYTPDRCKEYRLHCSDDCQSLPWRGVAK